MKSCNRSAAVTFSLAASAGNAAFNFTTSAFLIPTARPGSALTAVIKEPICSPGPFTCMMNLHCDEFPAVSVAVHTTVLMPIVKMLPEGVGVLRVTGGEQVSVAAGVGNVTATPMGEVASLMRSIGHVPITG